MQQCSNANHTSTVSQEPVKLSPSFSPPARDLCHVQLLPGGQGQAETPGSQLRVREAFCRKMSNGEAHVSDKKRHPKHNEEEKQIDKRIFDCFKFQLKIQF